MHFLTAFLEINVIHKTGLQKWSILATLFYALGFVWALWIVLLLVLFSVSAVFGNYQLQ